MQKALQFMEDHLLENIKIEEIAKHTHSSSFHFQRTFSILTDMTVADYLRRRRLTLAAQELASTDARIIDIALKYGYETPEAFSKAFRKQHQLSPSDVKNHVGKIIAYNRLVIQVNLKGAEPMNYRIVERNGFKVVGVKREYSIHNEQNLIGIPKFWREVNQDGTDDLLFQLNNGKIKGVLGVCICVDRDNRGEEHERIESGMIDYWIGTEHVGVTPDNLLELDIPASKWAVFEVRGPMPDAMQTTWKKIMSEWFPSNAYVHAGTPDLEVYSDEDPSSPDLYSEIWIPVK